MYRTTKGLPCAHEAIKLMRSKPVKAFKLSDVNDHWRLRTEDDIARIAKDTRALKVEDSLDNDPYIVEPPKNQNMPTFDPILPSAADLLINPPLAPD